MIGQHLRHYRIEERIGAGGMGVVYKAHDTHLGRAVALKVLSPGALSSEDRRRRFVQEAKSASGLNHPNIITIYDIDTAEAEGQPVTFIAMEYVAGQTLDRLIGKRGLKVKEALRYAVQIADALSAAHASNIIHRDLKPSNVMVNEQGLVKLLDFGLAKLSEPVTADSQAADAYATTEFIAPKTEEGVIVGTAAYMSPEQAEGRKLDARSDIFSFGSLLYEMAAGRRAFEGESKVATLSAILLQDPAPLPAGEFPEEFERIVGRCLRKEPGRRWQSARDLKVALEDLRDELETGRAARPPARRRGPDLLRRLREWALPVLAGVALGGAPALYVGRLAFHRDPPSFQRLTYRRGDILGARFAPDGSVVYSAEWDGKEPTVYMMKPGNRESRELGLGPAVVLSLSKGGELALELPNGALARVPLSGGAPREVLAGVSAADWSPDGASLAVVRRVDGHYRVEYPIGSVLHTNEYRRQEWVKVSRNGDQVAFFDYDHENGDYGLMIAGKKGEKRTLARGFRGVGGLTWSPDGRELWFCGLRTGGDPAVFAVKLTGRERVIVQSTGWLIVQGVSDDGGLLVSAATSRVATRGKLGAGPERDLSWHETSLVQDLETSGKAYLFSELGHGDGRNSAIYYRKADGSPAVHLGDGHKPLLSPDGGWVVCIRREASETYLLLLPTGAGEQRLIRFKNFRHEEAEWFPDGKHILITGNETGRPVRSYQQEVSGGAPAKPVTGEGERAGRVSPDGLRVVVTRRDGSFAVRSLAGGEQRELAGLRRSDRILRWSGDGQSLLAARVSGPVIELLRYHVARGTAERIREVRLTEPGASFVGKVVVSADGESYAYSYQRDLANLYLIRGLR